MKPLISIIMTAYNTSRYLPEALDSVLAQTYTNWELLVADDGSKDDSKRIIDAYALKDERIKPHHNSANLHYLRTRNALFTKSKGEYITLLDSDDKMVATRLATQLNCMLSNPKLALCGSFVDYMDEFGMPISIPREDPPMGYDDILKALPNHNPITGSTIFIKREVLLEFGGYRDFFHGLCSEDYDLVSRVAEKYPVINIPERLYTYRQFSSSTSRSELGNPYKKFSGNIVQQLISQRRNGQIDAIQSNDLKRIEIWIEGFLTPYLEDPSKVFIDEVSSHLYSGLKRKALNSALKAIRANPTTSYNYRTLWYVLKQVLK
jgi:glycosyltransferase involved in cell wall biosynthesis